MHASMHHEDFRKLQGRPCMLRAGDVAGGLAYASNTLDELPAEQHNDHVYALGRAVLTFVPRREWGRPEAAELCERLAAPADR